MGSIGNPKTWVPLMKTKDCSKGVCSLYCRQWCSSIFPPPPPIEFSVDISGPNFSPLVIAIIGILASAFLLVSYYAIISKYCGNVDSSRRRDNEDNTDEALEMEDNQNPFAREPWQNSTTGLDEAWQTSTTATGLDEALIKSITVCKYRKGDGLIEGTECSVCLSEFQEDENLRLLPKCRHAFHVHCIDTWLRSHSNCPLCRANIIFISASSPLPLPPPVTESPPGNEYQPSQDRPPPVRNENVAAPLLLEVGRVQSDLGGLPKIPSRAFSDLGNVQGRETVIEVREEEEEEEDYQQIRRSVSMDHFCRNQFSVTDILHMNQEQNLSSGAGPSKQSAETSKIGNKMRVLHCVMNPAVIRRSFSSGRFFLTRQGRVRDPSVPL